MLYLDTIFLEKKVLLHHFIYLSKSEVIDCCGRNDKRLTTQKQQSNAKRTYKYPLILTPFFNCFNKLRIMFNNCISYIPIGRTKAYRPHASVQVIKEDTWHVYIWSGKYSTQRWEKVCWSESPIMCGTCISNTGADPGVCYRRGKCVKSLCSIRDKKNIFKHVSRTYGTLTEILVCRFLNIVKRCQK